MIKAKTYERFSSDLQTDKSIEDQRRICNDLCQRFGWTVVADIADHGISGESSLRPGFQKLLEGIRNREFDIIVAESLDRLSRDQEHVAHLFKRAKYAGIKIFTVSEGEINELHIGMKGTMGQLFLTDLAKKTHRGLTGVALKGKCAGGKTYGYDVVIKHDEHGERVRGDRTVNEMEASIVKRIFKEYIAGSSPKAICVRLNKEGVVGPRGGAWGQSTINGNRRRGTGILNNELYIGRQIWNRRQFRKHPDTEKRTARDRDQSEMVIVEVPEFRILEQDL